MAIYELTVLERLDKNSVKSRAGSASIARDSIAELIGLFDVKVLMHSYDGVKRLAYECDGEQFAGYDYYELEIDDDRGSTLCKAIDQLLTRWLTPELQKAALRWLCVKRYTEDEVDQYLEPKKEKEEL